MKIKVNINDLSFEEIGSKIKFQFFVLLKKKKTKHYYRRIHGKLTQSFDYPETNDYSSMNVMITVRSLNASTIK